MPRGVYERKTKPGWYGEHPRRSIADRFWPKVEKTDACWLWTASLDGHGYGQMQVGTLKAPRMERAHRISYRLAHGEIPAGKAVLHTCDVRRCVRPDHLVLGTNAENQADKVAKGRQLKGEHIFNAKLSEAQVIELRRLHANGMLNMTGAAKHYGTSVAAISNAVNGKTWKHLTSD